MTRVLVAGGGIAGLTVAYRLQRAGLEVALWEAAESAGGCIRSIRHNGYLFEAGPTSFLGSARHLWKLAEELGLADRVVAAYPTAARRYIYRDGRLYALPTGPLSALTSPVLSVPAKLRVLREPWVSTGQAADESVYDFFARRFGAEVADYLVDPFVSGVYAGDARQLGAAAAFPQLVQLERDHGSVLRGLLTAGPREEGARRRGLYSFREGLETLPRVLAGRLGSALHLQRPLVCLDRDAGGRWQVESRGEWHIRIETFDAVVLATPAYTSAELVAGWAPELAQLLASIPYAPVISMALGVPAHRIAHPLDGFGFLVPSNQHRQLLGCLWLSSSFAGRAPAGKVALAVFMGGAGNPELLQYSAAGLEALVLHELTEILGLAGAPDAFRIFRHPRAIPQYTLGHMDRIERVQKILARYPGLYLAGNFLRGVSMDDTADQSSQLAARIIRETAAGRWLSDAGKQQWETAAEESR